MKKKLFFGTNNPHKLSEIREMLGEEYELLSFQDVPPLDVEETEATLEGNAALKAVHFYVHTQLPCFGDDTGLEVQALGGAPGVYSARYAGEPANAEANIALLLQNLAGITDRRARFCTLIAYFDGDEIRYFEGTVKGNILTEKRGEKGFGYDPVFVPDGQTQSFAEMSSEKKHALSHRGIALRKFVAFLQNNTEEI